MNAIAVLFGGALRESAFKELSSGKSSFLLSLQRAASLGGVTKITLLVKDDFDESLVPQYIERIEIIKKENWQTKNFLETIAAVCAGFDLVYFAWADTPLLDTNLTAAIEKRHTRYAAEYSYADGWPYGLSPELLLPSTAAFLVTLNANEEKPVERDTLFSVLQKDINSFDIETEISPVDMRGYRINLAADSKRNYNIIKSFLDAGWTDYDCASKIIVEHPSILRSLPSFFPIMVSAKCPQECVFCPFSKEKPAFQDAFMPLEKFELLLNKIIDFADDGVIDLSLWGELSLHPQKIELIAAVLKRSELALIIETCGIGWHDEDINAIALIMEDAPPRKNGMAALSWIVSLDSSTEDRYRELHGGGFDEAVNFVKKITPLFLHNVYVQALRCKGAEDEIEKFYRFWKAENAKVIIQKYDYFCGKMPDLRAGDISPVIRGACWHIMRDMPVLLDGNVVSCRETIVFEDKDPYRLGNALSEPLELIWQRGEALYNEHCGHQYKMLCENCDEYYTYNF